MRIVITVGGNSFEVEGDCLRFDADLLAALQAWLSVQPTSAPLARLESLTTDLERQSSDLAAAVVTHAPPPRL